MATAKLGPATAEAKYHAALYRCDRCWGAADVEGGRVRVFHVPFCEREADLRRRHPALSLAPLPAGLTRHRNVPLDERYW